MYDGTLVRLRALEPEDIDAHHRWFNDPEITRYLATRYPLPRARTAERVADWMPTSYTSAHFAMERRDTGELIGLAVLRDATAEDRDAEVDFLIGERDAWGQGFGTDGMRTLCRFGFEEMGLHRIHLYVYTDNVAAIRLYERLGFVREGVQRHAFWKRGAWHDCLLMGLLAGELVEA